METQNELGPVTCCARFDQSYNAQAVVATQSLLVVAHEGTQAANDKEQLVPMIEKIQGLPQELGCVERVLADNGYLGQANVEQCAAAGIESDSGAHPDALAIP